MKNSWRRWVTGVHPRRISSSLRPLPHSSLCFLTLPWAEQLSSVGPFPYDVLRHLGPREMKSVIPWTEASEIVSPKQTFPSQSCSCWAFWSQWWKRWPKQWLSLYTMNIPQCGVCNRWSINKLENGLTLLRHFQESAERLAKNSNLGPTQNNWIRRFSRGSGVLNFNEFFKGFLFGTVFQGWEEDLNKGTRKHSFIT